MATAQSKMTSVGAQSDRDMESSSRRDAAESILKTVDESTKGATGVSLFHILTFGSIGASIALYIAGTSRPEYLSVYGRRRSKRSNPWLIRTMGVDSRLGRGEGPHPARVGSRR